VPVETADTAGSQQLTVSATAQVPDLAGSSLSPAVPLKYKREEAH
jgi:hypothetical protein